MNSDKSPVYDHMKADKAKEVSDRSEETRIPMYDEMLAKEAEEKTKAETPPSIEVGEFKMPVYDEMLKEKTMAAPESDIPLNKSVEKVKEGDVSSLESKSVVYGAAKEGMVAKQLREFEELKGKDIKIDPGSDPVKTSAEKTSKEFALERQAKRGASPEQLKNYENAYVGWKEARSLSDRLEKEFNEKYTQHLEKESKGWRKVANIPRKLFGIRPRLTQELQSLEGASQVARRDYFEKAKLLRDSKLNTDGHIYGDVGRAAAAIRKKQGVPAGSKGIEANEMARDGKVLDRYQQMLAHKIVVGVHEKRVAIQEKISLEADKNSKLRPILEKVNKYKYVRMGTIGLGYAVLAGATGGLGAAALAGGGYAVRAGAGMIGGGYAGSLMRGLGRSIEKDAREDLGKLQSGVKSDLFERGFMEADMAVDELTRDIQKIRGITNTASAAVAMTAGFAAGALVDADIPGGEKGGGQNPENLDEKKFVNDGNNPGNPNAPGYFDIKGPEYVNDGNNPGNPNAPGYFDITPPPNKIEVTVPGDIPRAELDGVPPDLVKPPVQEMGDASVAEAMSKRTGEIIDDIESGDRTPPKFQNVHPEYDGPKHHTPGGPGWNQAPEAEIKVDGPKVDADLKLDGKEGADQIGEGKEPGKVEAGKIEVEKPGAENVVPPNDVPPAGLEGVPPGLEKAPDKFYAVQDTDKKGLWNVLEGNGPDNNPVGGQSEVLKGMPKMERWAALNTLLDYMEKNPEFVKEVGMLKGNGDINRLFPGENLNISLLDNKLRELLGLEVKLPESAPVPESNPILTPAEAPVPTPRPETAPIPTPRPDTLPVETAAIPTPRPDVVLETTPAPIAETALPETAPVPESRPEAVAGLSEEKVAAKVSEYVKDIERPNVGFFESLVGLGKPAVPDTYQNIAEMTIGEFKALAANDNLPEVLAERGIDQNGFVRWGETLQEQTQRVAANDNEPIGAYIERVVSGSKVA